MTVFCGDVQARGCSGARFIGVCSTDSVHTAARAVHDTVHKGAPKRTVCNHMGRTGKMKSWTGNLSTLAYPMHQIFRERLEWDRREPTKSTS